MEKNEYISKETDGGCCAILLYEAREGEEKERDSGFWKKGVNLVPGAMRKISRHISR